MVLIERPRTMTFEQSEKPGLKRKLAHGWWRYDVTTGSTLNVPGYGVTSYPAKVVDGKILVAFV
jgi:hypothetical protein